MTKALISLFSEQCKFNYPNSGGLIRWISLCLDRGGHSISGLNIIFCKDEYLLEKNRLFLGHDYYTDIITFDNSEEMGVIDAELYISIDRVRENSRDLKLSFNIELDRVIIHGLLHLMGYSDKTRAEKKLIREKEDAYLLLRSI